MAILSNINGKFRVDSAGAVYFGTSAGTNLQVLQSIGTGGSPTWVNVDDIIGGPYVPIAGDVTINGYITLAAGKILTVGGNLFVTGTSTLTGVLSGSTGTFSGSGTILSLNRNAPGTSLIELKTANTIRGKLGATTTKSLVVYSDVTENAHVENNGNIGLYGSAINFLIGDFAEINFRESGAITIDSDNNQSSRNFQIKDGSGSTLLSVLDTGYVGINYASPSDYIHILGQSGLQSGSAGIKIQTHDTANATASLSLLSRNASNVNSTVILSNNAGTFNVDSNSTFAGNVTTGGQVTVPAGYSVNIGTSRIHSTATSYLLGGNVGIGTTSPDYQLDIENSSHAVVRIHAGVNSSASLRLKNDAQDWDVNTQTNDTFAIFNQTTGTQPFSILPNGNVGIGVTGPSYKLSVATTLSSGSHLNADFGDENSPTAQFVGQGGNVYDSGGIYRSTVIIAPSSGAITTLFLSTYSSGHWGCQPTFQLKMNGTYYRSGYIEYWCQGIPSSSLKYVVAGPYGTMSDTLSVTVTRLCNTCHGGQPIDRQDWSFTTQGSYLRVSPIIITNKVGRRYFNNSSFSALNTLQSSASPIGPAYFFHGLSADQAAGSSNVYTIT